MGIGTIIVCVVVVASVIAVAVGVCIIKRKLTELSQSIFGTNTISEGINDQKRKISTTPRSLHSVTSVYLPRIQRDFPEFEYEHYKSKAQSLLRSYLNSLESGNPQGLTEECSPVLKNQVEGIIGEFKSRNHKIVFDEIVLHDTQIARYNNNKSSGMVSILFVTSVEYFTYIKDQNGKIIFGDKEYKTQTVYETELVYVQDIDKANTEGSSIGLNCPNCGAPIKNLGVKFCEYCGTGVTEINIRSWKFNSIKEQSVNKKIY